MAIDMYSTRTMIEALKQIKPPKSFLADTFFPNEKPFDTEHVDIDIYKGKRRMAAFVAPRIGSKTVERTGFSTNTYKPSLVAEDMITTSEDLLKRGIGETIYSATGPNERAAAQLANDLMTLQDRLKRRKEWMCAQALFVGSITMTGEGVSDTVSFGLDTTHNITLTSTDLWTNAASKPLDKLREWKRLALKDSGIAPNIMVMGSSVVDAFINNTQVKALLDLRRIDLGVINPTMLPDGVTYIGFIRDVGLDIYSYDEWYTDDSDVEQPMVPVDKVLLASSNARFDMLYGAIVDVNRGTFALPEVPKSWTQEKPSARFVALSSRPLPVPVQIDSVIVAKVV